MINNKNQTNMKTTTKVLLTFAVLCGIAVSSCKKYEEGPSVSLLSKKSRLAGEWTIDKVLYNGSDVTSMYFPSGTSYKLTIEKGGSWNDAMTSSAGTSTEKGTWEFVNKKEDLKMVTEGSGDADGDTSVIIKLKSKELWFEQKSGSNTTRFQLKQ